MNVDTKIDRVIKRWQTLSPLRPQHSIKVRYVKNRNRTIFPKGTSYGYKSVTIIMYSDYIYILDTQLIWERVNPQMVWFTQMKDTYERMDMFACLTRGKLVKKDNDAVT